jgi:RHS repeat-associated protein
MPMKARYTSFSGRVVREDRGGTVRDYGRDTLGSTAALYDEAGNRTDEFHYWPYGEVRSQTGSSATPLTFVGTLGYYADSARRYYVRARVYRADLGRWTTFDPLWPGESAYGYAGGNPASRVDPLGLLTKSECRSLCVIFEKRSDASDCQAICKRLSGNTCEALAAMCKHHGRHHEGVNADVCRKMADKCKEEFPKNFCPIPLPLPAPAPWPRLPSIRWPKLPPIRWPQLPPVALPRLPILPIIILPPSIRCKMDPSAPECRWLS